MLKPVAPSAASRAEVVACSTCRASADAPAGERSGGARLGDALRRIRDGDPAYAPIDVAGMPCLFACKDHCAIHLRAPGKVGYVLGRFAPTDDAARAILEYALAYAASEWGQVPFRDWPEGVKGHFIVRTPPPGFVAE